MAKKIKRSPALKKKYGQLFAEMIHPLGEGPSHLARVMDLTPMQVCDKLKAKGVPAFFERLWLHTLAAEMERTRKKGPGRRQMLERGLARMRKFDMIEEDEE